MRRPSFWFSVAVLSLATVPALGQRISLTDTAPIASAELMSRLADDAFTEIRQKYNDLQKNFTPHYLTSGLDLDCRTGSSSSSDAKTFSGVRFENKVKQVSTTTTGPARVETVISISHFDCYSKLIFAERIRVIGASAKPITIQEAVKFQRIFLTSVDETYRDYSIEDEMGRTIVSIRSEQKTTTNGTRILTSIELGGKQWMATDEVDIGAEDRRFTARFMSGEYFLLGGRVTFYLGVPELEFRQRWTSKKLVHEISGVTSSQSNFDETIQDLSVRVTGIFLKAVITGFVQKFPETVHVMVGVSDSPFLRELQLNYNRVLLKKEEAQVRQFFEKTIQDIKEGRLKVE